MSSSISTAVFAAATTSSVVPGTDTYNASKSDNGAPASKSAPNDRNRPQNSIRSASSDDDPDPPPDGLLNARTCRDSTACPPTPHSATARPDAPGTPPTIPAALRGIHHQMQQATLQHVIEAVIGFRELCSDARNCPAGIRHMFNASRTGTPRPDPDAGQGQSSPPPTTAHPPRVRAALRAQEHHQRPTRPKRRPGVWVCRAHIASAHRSSHVPTRRLPAPVCATTATEWACGPSPCRRRHRHRAPDRPVVGCRPGWCCSPWSRPR